ncbi:UV DNA damage repair endonuclease UvsE [Romboutsia ilealis]|uniref:UV DNA damage repair endonuclease UvsE n=1 Tax=Romboutsia faecis TaxID=2764597 RepID=A0ABR7JKR2_9FIRM|nr:UV DNA damage repair endonuclease UvsE [Romboutsia faecis]MBC5995517.1 UV DNA damage repair endonuclease UvsE [Romboutsia faecis]MRN23717.1 UV DNA damage repair endonuclease UvsE [Romboutsia ilealis]
MKVRLGYVAIALNLDKITSSSTVTYSRYSKINSEQEKLSKLKEVTYSNLEALEKILKYNIDHNIHFYRITSNLVPLATHPDVMWDYKKYFRQDFLNLGNIIKKSNMRVDSHPDQFNVINSTRESVIQSTLVNLNNSVDIFELLNYELGKMVIHIGSSQGGKEESIKRFIRNFNNFPRRIQERLILENDDKVFTAKDVLQICKNLKVPMVLDIHHHNCKNEGEYIGDLLEEIFNTWNEEILPPKLHFSTPKEFENDRKHADYIDADGFASFIQLVKSKVDRDIDIMIEAKKKDKALLKLIEDLRKTNLDFKFIDETTIEV